MTHVDKSAHDHEAELLLKVRHKEEEMNDSLQAFKNKTRVQINESKQDSDNKILQSEINAKEDADQYCESRRKSVTAESEKIISRARELADSIYKEATRNSDSALELIMTNVFPSQEEKFNIPSGVPS